MRHVAYDEEWYDGNILTSAAIRMLKEEGKKGVKMIVIDLCTRRNVYPQPGDGAPGREFEVARMLYAEACAQPIDWVVVTRVHDTQFSEGYGLGIITLIPEIYNDRNNSFFMVNKQPSEIGAIHYFKILFINHSAAGAEGLVLTPDYRVGNFLAQEEGFSYVNIL